MGCRDTIHDPVYRDGRWWDSAAEWGSTYFKGNRLLGWLYQTWGWKWETS